MGKGWPKWASRWVGEQESSWERDWAGGKPQHDPAQATRLPEPKRATPRLLGVDDWAFRRRSSYGTILLDLETHQPVDLLPDRTAETLAAWLVAHPGVQLISRDRAGEYAQSAKKGASEAIKVADRFHLSKNLSEVVECILSHHRQALCQIRFMPASPRSDSPLAVRYPRPDRQRRQKEVRQARQARAEQIQQLLAQGMTQLAIARQLHLNRKTVALYAKTPSLAPVWQPDSVYPLLGGTLANGSA